MSKKLPYFQFEPAQYLTGSIQDCSLEAQGLFSNIQAIYWQRDCSLLLETINKRFKREDLVQELIKNEIIKIKNEKIVILFLIAQRKVLEEKKTKNSINGSKGAKTRWKRSIEENGQAILSPLAKTEKTIALRREEIRREEKREDNINIEKELLASFSVIERARMILKESQAEVEQRLRDFIAEQKAIGGFEKRTIEDVRAHFINLTKIIQDKKPKQATSTPGFFAKKQITQG